MGRSQALERAIVSGLNTDDLVLLAIGARDENTRQKALLMILKTRIREIGSHSDLWRVYFKPGHPAFERVAQAIILHAIEGASPSVLEKILTYSKDLRLRNIAWSRILRKVTSEEMSISNDLLSLPNIPPDMQRGICIMSMKSAPGSLHGLAHLQETYPYDNWEQYFVFQGLSLPDLVTITEWHTFPEPLLSADFVRKSFDAVFQGVQDETYRPRDTEKIADFLLCDFGELVERAKNLSRLLANTVLQATKESFNVSSRDENYPVFGDRGWGHFYPSKTTPDATYLYCIYAIAISPLTAESQSKQAISSLRNHGGLTYHASMHQEFVNLTLAHPAIFDEIFPDAILGKLLIHDLHGMVRAFGKTQIRLLQTLGEKSTSQQTQKLLKNFST